MNNVFNSVQTHGTKDDCKKFSKSVSHETLVVGTATIGRGIKQTRRLSKGSANKPLSAVGTLTSLLCNSAKVVEKWLQTSLVLRLVKIFSLSMILSFSIVTESRTEVVASGNCSADEKSSCHWEVDTEGNLFITGSGKMQDYSVYDDFGRYTNNTPWKNLGVKSVDIQGVENIGQGAFFNLRTIRNVDIGNTVKSIGGQTFNGLDNGWAPRLDTLILSENLNDINWWCPFDNTTISTILSPDTLSPLLISKLNSRYMSNSKVICLGNIEKCRQAWKNKIAEENILPADYTNCKFRSYFWNGAGCIREPDLNKRKCCDSCKDMGGWCNRIKYTPAEAASLLHNDNTNEVTITFRK